MTEEFAKEGRIGGTGSPRRVASVDVVRGVLMALMMVDHVREFFFLHRQVLDPVDLRASGLPLAFTRFASHPCAPGFVLLAGLSAALRKARRGDDAASEARYLVRRGLWLILLEVTVINFAWTFRFPPAIVYLQVIWAIGLSMIALAGLVFLPRWALLALSTAIVLGHNALDGVSPPEGPLGNLAWSVVHQRARIEVFEGFTLRVSYPVLPYVGVIGLGYALGRLYAPETSPRVRRGWLVASGLACLIAFLALRPLNLGLEPGRFEPGGSPPWTLASLVNATKYPPSTLFLLMTLGPTLILLALAEGFRGRVVAAVARFGAAPMLYYVLHLYALHAANRLAALATGTAGLYGFDDVSKVWLATAGFLAVVGPLTVWLAGHRGRRAAESAAPPG